MAERNPYSPQTTKFTVLIVSFLTLLNRYTVRDPEAACYCRSPGDSHYNSECIPLQLEASEPEATTRINSKTVKWKETTTDW